MIDALVSGRLAADPKSGSARSGSRYVTARLWVAFGGEERVSVSVIAFNELVCERLLALGAGESVALTGELTPKVWESPDGPKASADLKAHAILTPYEVRRRRSAAEPAE